MKSGIFTYLLLSALTIQISVVEAQTTFQEVTGTAGITYDHKSWGASFGDANNDGLMDIYTSNHWRIADGFPPSIYLNQGDGSFLETTPPYDDVKDMHGAGFADYDNDGDQDLCAEAGGKSRIAFFQNRTVDGDGDWLEIANSNGTNDSVGRGRTPVWFDLNNDGLLDLIQCNAPPRAGEGQIPTSYYEQQPDNTFIRKTNEVGLVLPESCRWVELSDVTGDGKMNMTFEQKSSVYVFDFDTAGFTLNNIISAPNLTDFITEDFNGDLKQDMMLLTHSVGSAVDSFNATQIHGVLAPEGDEKSFTFSADSTLSFKIVYLHTQPDSGLLKVGASGYFPGDTHFFDLDPNDPANWGIQSHTPGVDTGVYIGYNPTLGQWQISHSTTTNVDGTFYDISSLDTIQIISVSGFPLVEEFDIDQLLYSSPGGLTDATVFAGMDIGTGSYTVTTGDFDNDKDIDIYLACISKASTLPNRMFLNNGVGVFTELLDAGGAVGTIYGQSESSISGDYDNDGFLDIFLTNGKGDFLQGPFQLYHNQGNGNNWLEIDLTGTVSNRNGIGATLFAYSGGTAQVRERNNGVHRYQQDAPRIHFGLGSDTMVDSLIIYWPSGATQRIYNIDANQLIKIVESKKKDYCSFTKVNNLQVDSIGTTSAFLSWSALAGASKYKLEARQVGSSIIKKIQLTSNSYSLTSLKPGRTYQWRVKAKCGINFSQNSNIRTFTTLVLRSGNGVFSKLYPNPANEFIQLDYQTTVSDFAHIEIFSITGQLVSEQWVETQVGTNQFSIDLHNLSAGLYNLRFTTESTGTVDVFPFVTE